MFAWLLSLITGTGGIAAQIEKAYQAKLNAQNDGERIAADVAIAQLSARQASLVRGGIVSAVVQFLFAAPFIAFNAKIIVWDRMLGLGSTPELSPILMNIEWTIVGFYFLRAVFR